MNYVSKKDPSVIAKVVEQNEKYKTVILEYLTGENAGKTISITTSTLHRWWEEDNSQPVKIDYEVVNTPYPEPKTQRYIPKPQSVIEYEEKKAGKKNTDLPTFEKMVEDMGAYSCKVNERSSYLKLNDKSTVWRKSSKIDVYASEELWIKLTNLGFTSSANKDKDRPFAFTIKSADEYSKLLEVVTNG